MPQLPQWLIDLLVSELMKFLTPELIQKFEAEAIQLVCCKLATLAKDSATAIDDEIVQKVAAALGADLSKCQA